MQSSSYGITQRPRTWSNGKVPPYDSNKGTLSPQQPARVQAMASHRERGRGRIAGYLLMMEQQGDTDAATPGWTDRMRPDHGAQICRRGLSLRACFFLQLAGPSCVLQEFFHRRRRTPGSVEHGLRPTARPTGAFLRYCFCVSTLSSWISCGALCSFLPETRRIAAASVVVLPAFVSHRLIARCGGLLRRCDGARPSSKVIGRTGDAVVWRGAL